MFPSIMSGKIPLKRKIYNLWCIVKTLFSQRCSVNLFLSIIFCRNLHSSLSFRFFRFKFEKYSRIWEIAWLVFLQQDHKIKADLLIYLQKGCSSIEEFFLCLNLKKWFLWLMFNFYIQTLFWPFSCPFSPHLWSAATISAVSTV